MNTVVVQSGQTFADIAVQEYGSFEAAIEIAMDNGMSITDNLSGGSVLRLTDRSYNRIMQNYCRTNGVSPATALDEEEKYGGIGFMAVGVDFIVS